MPNIKAFVGHSFTEDDAGLVTAFLKIFDQIKGALPAFEWTHAQQAEPEELAKKVLRQVEDCNTFIAICTKKEIVAAPSAVSRRLFFPEQSTVKSAELAWKTSDWIIQEIGLAVGRGMSIVLLIEAGCRRPGGLQGDVEFIPFEREHPERAFGQILEMFKALNPSLGTTTEKISLEADVDPAEVTTEEAPVEEDGETPKPHWTLDDYETAAFWKIYRKDKAGLTALNETFRKSPLGSSEEPIALWDAKCEEWKLLFGEDGNLQTLKVLSDKFPTNGRIQQAYASGLSVYNQHDDSAKAYEVAASIDSDPGRRLSNLTEAALQHQQAGQTETALRLIADAKALAAGDTGLELATAYAISRFAESVKDDTLRIQAMERIVALRPDDESTRFTLAYAHSEADRKDIGLHHYLAIPFSKRKSHVWNNLGVSYQEFSAPARAMDAFERSAAAGNSLAMSNLAYRYMNAGFLTEAKSQLDAALQTSEPHKNVGQAIAELSAIPEREAKSIDEVLSSTVVKVETFKKLGQAICDPDISALNPVWNCPDCSLNITVVGRRFEARGRYAAKANALTGLLGTPQSTEYDLTLRGTIFGRRVFGEVERKAVGSTTSLLGDAEARKTFAIIFDSSLKHGEVVESLNTRHPRRYDIHVADTSIVLPAPSADV